MTTKPKAAAARLGTSDDSRGPAARRSRIIFGNADAMHTEALSPARTAPASTRRAMAALIAGRGSGMSRLPDPDLRTAPAEEADVQRGATWPWRGGSARRNSNPRTPREPPHGCFSRIQYLASSETSEPDKRDAKR